MVRRGPRAWTRPRAIEEPGALQLLSTARHTALRRVPLPDRQCSIDVVVRHLSSRPSGWPLPLAHSWPRRSTASPWNRTSLDLRPSLPPSLLLSPPTHWPETHAVLANGPGDGPLL